MEEFGGMHALAAFALVEGTGMGMGFVDAILHPFFQWARRRTADIPREDWSILFRILRKLEVWQDSIRTKVPFYWPIIVPGAIRDWDEKRRFHWHQGMGKSKPGYQRPTGTYEAENGTSSGAGQP